MKILPILQRPNNHYHVGKRQTLVSVLNHTNTIKTFHHIPLS